MTGRYKVYPEYIAADSKWLDEIPAHWKVTALKHVLSTPVTDGPHSTPIFQDEGIPFVSAEAVSGGYINFDKIRGYISEEDDVLFSQKYRPQLNDVYMIKSGATTGICAIVDTNKRFNIWSPLAVMRCKKSYNPYFLLDYLRSDSFQKSVQLSWTFGTQQNIGMNTLENLTVCFPPFEEQQKIASFLDHETAKIDALIAKQEKLIELLKEKRQAVISHAVTKGLNPDAPMKDSGVEWLGQVPEHWGGSSIKYLSSFVGTGGTPKNQSSFVDDNDAIKWFTPGDFSDKIELTQSTKHISYEAVSSGDAKLYQENSVLVIGIGATLGKVGLCKDEFSCNQQINMITPNKKTTAEFITFSLIAQQEQMKQLSNASTIGIMNQEKTKSIQIAQPPLVEQIEIVNYLNLVLERFKLLESKATKQVDLLKERKTALISAAVTGKIDVRDWELK